MERIKQFWRTFRSLPVFVFVPGTFDLLKTLKEPTSQQKADARALEYVIVALVIGIAIAIIIAVVIGPKK